MKACIVIIIHDMEIMQILQIMLLDWNFVLLSQCHTLIKQFLSICLTDFSSVTENVVLRSKCDMENRIQAKTCMKYN